MLIRIAVYPLSTIKRHLLSQSIVSVFKNIRKKALCSTHSTMYMEGFIVISFINKRVYLLTLFPYTNTDEAVGSTFYNNSLCVGVLTRLVHGHGCTATEGTPVFRNREYAQYFLMVSFVIHCFKITPNVVTPI